MTRRGSTGIQGLAPALLAVGLLSLVALPPGHPDPEGRPAGAPGAKKAALREDERAAAYGFFLDARMKPTLVEESLALAEVLQERYGIRTGDARADGAAAAARALEEVESRVVGESEIEAAAKELGYSLDFCADYCGNVRRLAVIHLKMKALRRLGE